MGKKVTFDSAPAPGTINFGVGQPSADLLPVDLLRQASEQFLRQAHPNELNYGERQGDARFREALASFLTRGYSAPVTDAELIVTGGNSQALDFICSLFTRPGDTVIVEEPSYFLAFQIFLDHGLKIVSVPMDEEGMSISALEKTLSEVKPKLLYTIPSFHNPGGQSMSLQRRKRLVALSEEHDFIIAADEVYQLLYATERPPPALGTMAGSGTILSLGSFSKIMAPGLRLGWIQTSARLMEPLMDSGAINSGGSLNHFTSHIIRAAIETGQQDEWLEHLRTTYRARIKTMDEALHVHVGNRARWTCPHGGYFFWLEFNESVDTAVLRSHGAEFRTGFQPGVNFSPTGKLRNYLRLSFAHYDENEIREGIARLGQLFDHYL